MSKAHVLDIKSLVNDKLSILKEYMKYGNREGFYITIIQVGDNPTSNSYIKGKIKDFDFVGIPYKYVKVGKSVLSIEIQNLIEDLNNDNRCAGIILQLPAYSKFEDDRLCDLIHPSKDIDGFRKDSNFIPCTPKGILGLIENSYIPYRGSTFCIIGMGKTVGTPLARILMEKGATVITCNSSTRNTEDLIRNSDVLIVATGKMNLINKDSFTKHEPFDLKLIIDVGINKAEDGKLYGDIDKSFIIDILGEANDDHFNYTSVPGGVGLLTRLSLVENSIIAIYNKISSNRYDRTTINVSDKIEEEHPIIPDTVIVSAENYILEWKEEDIFTLNFDPLLIFEPRDVYENLYSEYYFELFKKYNSDMNKHFPHTLENEDII